MAENLLKERERVAAAALGDMREYRSCLYVGANARRFQLYNLLIPPSQTVPPALALYVLEIWPDYAEELRADKRYELADVFDGDFLSLIREVELRREFELEGCTTDLGTSPGTVPADYAPYDLLVWWHGPEHVSEAEARYALHPDSGVHELYSKMFLIGAPFGHYRQGPVDGNPHQSHRWNPTPEWFQELGYEIASVGQAGVPRSGIIAWRRK